MSTTGVWKIATADPTRVAVVAVDGATTSFATLAAHSNQIAHGLAAMGLKPGDRIAISMRNTPEVVALFLGAMQSGLYVVPINFHNTANDVAFIIEDSESRALFTDPEFAGTSSAALDSINFPADKRFSNGNARGFVDLTAWRDSNDSERPAETVAGSIMFYTSGTTGRPKGVLRPLPGLDGDAGADQHVWLLKLFGAEPGPGAHLVNSPLYHSAVVNLGLSALHSGQTLVLMDGWEPETALALIERHRVTSTHMVATHFHRLLSLPDSVKAQYDLSSLTHLIHGAVPTPVNIKQRMMDWLGPVIHEYYGSSEVGGTSVSPEEWLAKPGTVGRPFSITRLEILDDNGQPVPTGKPGWVYMQQGDDEFTYHNDPEKTARASSGKLVCVGDIGYVDDEGFLFLCGRDAETIISGGVNIYPAAIEGHLLEHPAVQDVAVVGIPDEEFGEQVKAVVVAKPGYVGDTTLAADLIEHCRRGLAHMNCPKSVDFVEELPRDPTGKLYKQRVRDQYWQGRARRI